MAVAVAVAVRQGRAPVGVDVAVRMVARAAACCDAGVAGSCVGLPSMSGFVCNQPACSLCPTVELQTTSKGYPAAVWRFTHGMVYIHYSS